MDTWQLAKSTYIGFQAWAMANVESSMVGVEGELLLYVTPVAHIISDTSRFIMSFVRLLQVKQQSDEATLIGIIHLV